MCIIIAINKKTELKNFDQILKNSYLNNNDSGGYGFFDFDQNKFKIVKFIESKNFDKFKDKFFKDFEKHNQKSGFLIHFRIATHGKIDLKNAHPFKLKNHNLIFAHNGVISGFGNKEISDTLDFSNIILEKLPNGFLNNKSIIKLLEIAIDNSKLAFLDNKGNIKIINKHFGLEKYNIWFSNKTFKNYVNHYSHYYNYHNYYDNFWDLSKKETTDKKYCKCGKKLKKSYEKYIGYCSKCIKNKGLDLCEFCNEQLISEKELLVGICDKCANR